MTRIWLSLGLLGCLLGCSKGESAPVTTLRISGIPDSDKSELKAMYATVTTYLQDALDLPVEWVAAESYEGAVTALAANRVDVAWLGGVTSVQAENRTQGKVTFVACRESDLTFKSFIIANHEALASGKVRVLEDLAEFGKFAPELTLTFGSKSSTSGHIMPRHFLSQAGIRVDDAFKSVSYQGKGSHSATLNAVATGAVDVGALNYKTWLSAPDDVKQKAIVIYETPAYVDYCMVAHNRCGDVLIEGLRDALVSLDRENPDHLKVLKALSASDERFVAADPSSWDSIRSVLKQVSIE